MSCLLEDRVWVCVRYDSQFAATGWQTKFLLGTHKGVYVCVSNFSAFSFPHSVRQTMGCSIASHLGFGLPGDEHERGKEDSGVSLHSFILGSRFPVNELHLNTKQKQVKEVARRGTKELSQGLRGKDQPTPMQLEAKDFAQFKSPTPFTHFMYSPTLQCTQTVRAKLKNSF